MEHEPKLPDAIKSVAQKAGIILNDSSQPFVGSAQFVTAALQTAYANADYKTINTARAQASADMAPIFMGIQKFDTQYFNTMFNDDGTPYQLAISGPPNNPTGYMWIYAPPLTQNNSTTAAVTYDTVVQVGTFSSTGNILGISNSIWSSTVTLLPASLSLVISGMVIKTVRKVLSGDSADDAANAVAGQVLEDAVEEGTIDEAVSEAIVGMIIPCTAGLIVGFIVFVLTMFILKYIDKYFQLQITIYNWDPNNTWTVESDYRDNAVSDVFKKAVLLPRTGQIHMPDGTTREGVNKEVSVAIYNYQNDNKWFEGVGVAMPMSCSDGSSLQLKYVVHFGAVDNQIGLKGDPNQPLEDFYNNSGTWCPDDSTSWKTTVAGSGLPINCGTPALSGANDDMYSFDVHVGLQVLSSVQAPLPGALLAPGTTILLPGGREAKIGTLQKVQKGGK
ncbi:hypothetical protein MMC08_003986 [Hypocenomyce scalaris]|nr:hypothetical protein [Hypocenomyce scalaris]